MTGDKDTEDKGKAEQATSSLKDAGVDDQSLPHMRPDGARVTAQHPLRCARRAGDRADLKRPLKPSRAPAIGCDKRSSKVPFSMVVPPSLDS